MTEKCLAEKFSRLLALRLALAHENKPHISVLHFSVIVLKPEKLLQPA